VSAHEPMTSTPDIPGVSLVSLTMHKDERGMVSELFRAEWPDVIAARQWNGSHSRANVLRGVHLHHTHADYLVVLAGHMQVGLCDLRGGRVGAACLVDLRGEEWQALVIPPGVAHGFYFPAPTMHIYAVTHYWDPADELGCRWDDPALGIPWPKVAPMLSSRDAALPTASVLLDTYSRCPAPPV
jgi:dTDP-4-dehydrorhamnose 3,5-epimerase